MVAGFVPADFRLQHDFRAAAPAGSATARGEVHLPLREFLMDGFDEDQPGIFHAYFIVADDTSDASEQQRLAALAEAWWRGFELRQPYDQPMIPSVIYWPVTGISLAEARLAVERGRWEVLAAHYQYQRARVIFQRIQGLAGVGPFFVLAFQPLGQVVQTFSLKQGFPILVIDFSSVPKEKFEPLMRVVCERIIGNPQILDHPWKPDEMRVYFRGWLGTETDNTVWIKF